MVVYIFSNGDANCSQFCLALLYLCICIFVILNFCSCVFFISNCCSDVFFEMRKLDLCLATEKRLDATKPASEK